MSRFLSSRRRTTCTQRNTTRLSIFGISPRGFGLRHEVGRQQHLAGLGAQPRHRLVVADLALRQRHDRLQIEVDAVGIDGAADRREPFLVGGWSATRRRSPARCGAVRGRAAAAGATASATALDDVLHQRRQRLGHGGAGAGALAAGSALRSPVRGRGFGEFVEARLVGRDRFGELPDQRAELADLDRERIGRGARAVLTRFHPAFDARPAAGRSRSTWRASSELLRDRSLSWLPTTVRTPSRVENGVVEPERGQRPRARQ